MKIVIIGGHLGPALSVIETLPKNTDILFIGRKYALEGDKALSLEYKTIISSKIIFFPIVSARLQRKFTQHTIFSILKFPYGFFQSLLALKNFNPDVVLGFGGYVSLPVCFAAFFLRIPVVIHEQTLDAGLANRIISIFAKKICISWKSSGKYFPKEKTILTGLPIRNLKFSNIKDNQDLRIEMPNEILPIIYVTGGSLGSHFINTLIENYLQRLLEKFIVIHQTGGAKEFGDFERLSELKESLPENLQKRYILKKFIEPSDVGYILEKADLVVSRCGINTVAELIYFKKPSVLIPLPFSGKGEQIKNALFLRRKGVSEIFYQDEKKDFFKFLNEMFSNVDSYKKNTQNLANLVRKDAARKIIEVVLYVEKNKKK